MMDKFNSALKYCGDKFSSAVKYILDSFKLTILKLKVILFSMYVAIFSLNYFVHFKKENEKMVFDFIPMDVPASAIIATSVVVAFLVLIDVIFYIVRIYFFNILLKSNQISTEMKNRIMDEMLKSK